MSCVLFCVDAQATGIVPIFRIFELHAPSLSSSTSSSSLHLPLLLHLPHLHSIRLRPNWFISISPWFQSHVSPLYVIHISQPETSFYRCHGAMSAAARERDHFRSAFSLPPPSTLDLDDRGKDYLRSSSVSGISRKWILTFPRLFCITMETINASTSFASLWADGLKVVTERKGMTNLAGDDWNECSWWSRRCVTAFLPVELMNFGSASSFINKINDNNDDRWW